MNPTIRPADKVPSIVQKLVFELAEEETLLPLRAQLPLGGFEIEIDVELFEE